MAEGNDLNHEGKRGSQGEGNDLKPTDRQRQQESPCTTAEGKTKNQPHRRKHRKRSISDTKCQMLETKSWKQYVLPKWKKELTLSTEGNMAVRGKELTSNPLTGRGSRN